MWDKHMHTYVMMIIFIGRYVEMHAYKYINVYIYVCVYSRIAIYI